MVPSPVIPVSGRILPASTLLFFFNCILFLTGGLLDNIVMVSAIHQHESAKGIHMSPPS